MKDVSSELITLTRNERSGGEDADVAKTLSVAEVDTHLEKDDEYVLTPEEGKRQFDEAARAWLGISGEEFLRRYDAGEYAELVESEDNRRVIDLYFMIPLAR